MSFESPRLTRRTMLKWLGLGAASSLVMSCGGAAQPAPTTAPAAAPAATSAPAAVATIAPAATKAPSPVAKQVTLSFGQTGQPEEIEMTWAILDKFEKKFPNIKTDRKPVAPDDWAAIVTQFQGKAAPDVTRINDDDVYLIGSSGGLLVLDDLIKKNVDKTKYYDATWTALVVDGKQMCMIPGMDCLNFYVNLDLYNKATDAPPLPTDWTKTWDWETFKKAVNAITKKDTSGNTTQYALTYNLKSPGSMPWWIFGNGATQYNADETKCAMNIPTVVKNLQEWGDFVYKNHNQPDAGEDPLAMINGAKCVMYLDSMKRRQSISKNINWDLAPLPILSSGKAYTENMVRAFAIPAWTKNPEESFQLLNFLMQEEAQTDFAKVDWVVPSMKSIAESPAFMDPNRPPKHRGLWAQGLQYDVTLAQNPVATIWKKGKNDFAKVAAGQITAEQFMKDYCTMVDQEIARLNWKKKG